MAEYHVQSDRMLVDCREVVAKFAEFMEQKLRKNDHKTGWLHLPIEALRRLMMLEIEEFNVAREFFGKEEARAELVDIANFAMMLHDRLGVEDKPTEVVLCSVCGEPTQIACSRKDCPQIPV